MKAILQATVHIFSFSFALMEHCHFFTHLKKSHPLQRNSSHSYCCCCLKLNKIEILALWVNDFCCDPKYVKEHFQSHRVACYCPIPLNLLSVRSVVHGSWERLIRLLFSNATEARAEHSILTSGLLSVWKNLSDTAGDRILHPRKQLTELSYCFM